MSTDTEPSETTRSRRSFAAAHSHQWERHLADLARTGGRGLRHAKDPLSYRREILSTEELESAINDGKVTLSHIVMARYLSQEFHNPDVQPEKRGQYNKLTGQLLEKYENHGTWWVRDHHFCSYIPAGVVLRRRRRVSRFARLQDSIRLSRKARIPRKSDTTIDMVYLPEATETTDPEIEAAIWKSYSLYLAATQRRGERQYFLIQRIYSLIVYLLSLADAQAISTTDSERIAKEAPGACAELNHLEQSLKKAIVTEARQDYLVGMFSGVIFLMILVGVLLRFTSGKSAMHAVLGVIAAGGLGATLSVMSRLTANRLSVDAGADTALIRLAGGFRPVVGAVFGLALYTFIEADLLPINVTVTGQKLTYFYLAVAFLAGFSERFAQDAITKAGAAIVPDSPPAEDSAERP